MGSARIEARDRPSPRAADTTPGEGGGDVSAGAPVMPNDGDPTDDPVRPDDDDPADNPVMPDDDDPADDPVIPDDVDSVITDVDAPVIHMLMLR